MKNKAVFLDRDGTINIDYGYVHKSDNFEFIPGVIEALKLLQDLGYKLIIITNQSGIERGYYTEDDFYKLVAFMKNQLEKHNIYIDDVYFCPHLDSECNCRKPKLELFYRAATDHNIDFSMSYTIGDNFRDVAICDEEAVKGIVLSDKAELLNSSLISCKDLLDAASYIKRHALS